MKCDHCLSARHKTGECVVLGEEEGDVGGWVKAVESAVSALSQAGASRGGAAPSEIVNTVMHANGVEVLTLDMTALFNRTGAAPRPY